MGGYVILVTLQQSRTDKGKWRTEGMNEWINELINQMRVNRMIKKTRSQGKRLSENKLKTKQNRTCMWQY